MRRPRLWFAVVIVVLLAPVVVNVVLGLQRADLFTETEARGVRP